MAQHLRVGSVVTYGTIVDASVTNLTDAYIEIEYVDVSTSQTVVRVLPWHQISQPLLVVTD